MMVERKRDMSVDMAKGIGMLLVIMGHAGCPEIPHGIIYSFHMPLFFMLSGLFIQRQCKDKLGVYLNKNFRSLLLPYLYFNIIYIAFYYVMSVVFHKNLLDGSVWDNLIGIFVSMRWGTNYHHVLWFLPCLFFAKIMVYPLYHNKLGGGKIVISILSLIIGLVYSRFAKYPLPWAIDAAFVAVFFIVMGQLYMQNKAKIDKYIGKYSIVIACIYVISLLLNFDKVEMFNKTYGNEVLFLTGSLSASLLIVWICGKIKATNKVALLAADFGKLSLLVFTTHQYCLFLPITLHNRIVHNDVLWQNYGYWIASIVFASMLVLPLSKLINTKAKWLTGK